MTTLDFPDDLCACEHPARLHWSYDPANGDYCHKCTCPQWVSMSEYLDEYPEAE